MGGYASLALDPNDFPRVIYHDERKGSLNIDLFHDPFCENFILHTLDHSGEVELYTSLVVTPKGLFWISYLDQKNERLKLA